MLNDPTIFPVADFLDSSYSNLMNTSLLKDEGTKFIVLLSSASSLTSTLTSISPDSSISIPVNFHPVPLLPSFVESYSTPAITNFTSSRPVPSTIS
jgi:hypothetical protein